MTAIHSLVVRYANPFALHVVVSSVVLLIAIAASYLPRLAARTRFAVVAAGLAKFLVPASLFAPLMNRTKAASVIQFAVPDGFVAAVRTAPAPASSPLDVIVLIAMVICAIFLAVMVVAAMRTVSAASRSALPATPREVAVLNAARKRLGIAHAIDVVRSPISEAPAVVRVLRPLIILPVDGVFALDDDELESLLCHECAHVARRDNLLALVAGVIRAVFWFNPLVWLAYGRLAEEREKACDEIVAEDAQRAETYAQALLKICQAILARPAAGVSCMASAHLKRRMEHIMRYTKTPAAKFWHFALTSLAVVFLFGAVAATAAIGSGQAGTGDGPYELTIRVGQIGNDLYGVRVAARDKATSNVVWASRYLHVKANETFTASGDAAVGNEPALGFRTDGTVSANGQVTAHIEVTRGTDVVQNTTVVAVPRAEDRYTGAPVSITLKDAEIHDVLRAFAQMTGLDITAGPGVEGRVDVNMIDVPWDRALDEILQEHGYTWRMEGKKLVVTRM